MKNDHVLTRVKLAVGYQPPSTAKNVFNKL